MTPLRLAFAAAIASLGLACARIPTPLEPGKTGPIGLPDRGVIHGGASLPKRGPGYVFLRDNGRTVASERFAAALTRAAARVEAERPGAPLVFGDFSAPSGGGPLLPHFSHRNGSDADLLFYLVTLEGAPLASPGFVPIGGDGLTQRADGRLARLDLERQWLIAKALLTDPEARVQWIFVHAPIRAKLLAWAEARGEPLWLLQRAAVVMKEPNPGGAHDDHFHVRTQCSRAERAAGCEVLGPERPWLAEPSLAATEPDVVLARAILEPLPSPVADAR